MQSGWRCVAPRTTRVINFPLSPAGDDGPLAGARTNLIPLQKAQAGMLSRT